MQMPGRRYCLVLIAVAFLCQPPLAAAGRQVRLRINTSHGLENAQGAVTDAGLKTSDVSVTASSPDNGRAYLPPDRLIEDARSVGAKLVSSSFSGWNYIFDSAGYLQLTSNEMTHVYAYEPRKPQPQDVPPPAAFVTVNRIGGKTGGGIEFGVAVDYMNGKGQSITPSGVTAQLAGLMACLKYLHPSWNWFDIKAALRSTAANYATGYNHLKYGYGAIDYRAANALPDAAKLPLFAPAAVIRGENGDRLVFSVNPFKQSRRFTEVLFRFASRPAPTMKELTLAEITEMGGQYLFSSYLSTNADLYAYRMTKDETSYLVWFTQGTDGKFSRIEPYSVIGPIILRDRKL